MPNLLNQASLNVQDTTETLQNQLSFYKLLNAISARFHSSQDDDLDDAIKQTLQDIGSFIRADRAFLFLLSDNHWFKNNSHEWCADGIPSHLYFLRKLSINDYPWFSNQLNSKPYIYIPSAEKMPAAACIEQQLLTMYKIQSLIIVPLKRHEIIHGFLYLDAVTETRQWSSDDINMLMVVANIIQMSKNYQQSRDFVRFSRQLSNNIEEGILIVREPGQIIWINKPFSRISGYTYADVIGKLHFQLQLFEVDKMKIREIDQELQHQGKWSGILSGKHKDGSTYPAKVFINKNQDEFQSLARYLLIFRDITEEYKLEQERAALRKQTVTAQKLNSLSAMSAAVVHEIAQPLNAIKVLVDGMLYCQHNQIALPQSEIYEKLENVSMEMKRIDEIIQSIRTYANSNQSAELTSCSWNEAIERVLGLLGRQLAAHQIIFSPVPAADLPRMYANPLRLDEVLINLLVNAMHALDLTNKAEKEIICRTSYDDKHAILEIADNAYGIDESIQELIFEPFFTDKQSTHGMGLGLSIVVSIMTSLKGQVTVFNNDKGGATFHLELPII